MQRVLPGVIAAAAPLALIVTFAFGSAPDEEELRWGVLSSLLHVNALLRGELLTWTSSLGLGLPQPMVPNYNVHPLMPLLGAVSPIAWVRVLTAGHTLLGAFGMWHLTKALGLTPIVRSVCVFTFLLATPTQNYALQNFWPSHYVMWTAAPWLLLFAWRLLEAEGKELRRFSLLLGLCGGIALATTHPGHAPVYATVVIALAVSRWRDLKVRWRWAAIAGAMTFVIAGPNLLQLLRERMYFDPDLGVTKFVEPIPLSALWDVVFRPFYLTGMPWQDAVVSAGVRIPFFGGPFAILAAAALVVTRPSLRDLRLGVVLSAILLFTPLLPLTFLSRYHFRDPLLLCAIPLAGVMLDRLLATARTRLVGWTVLAVQVVVVTAGAVPLLHGMWLPESREELWMRGATAAQPVAGRLLRFIEGQGRVIYSPQVDYEVGEFGRFPDGLGVNALAYRGASIVNGSFKGVSTNVLWRDDRLFYGRIRVPRQQVESDLALDLLGIRYVIAKPGEAVAPGLRPLVTISDAYRSPVMLYDNPDAGPGAFLIEDATADPPTLPEYEDCSNTRLLCRDLTAFDSRRRREGVELTRRDGSIAAVVPASDRDQLLVIAEMFRPEWIATAPPGPLRVVSAGPGLLGVVVTPGVTSIQMTHRDILLMIATLACWATLAAAVLALGISRR